MAVKGLRFVSSIHSAAGAKGVEPEIQIRELL